MHVQTCVKLCKGLEDLCNLPTPGLQSQQLCIALLQLTLYHVLFVMDALHSST